MLHFLSNLVNNNCATLSSSHLCEIQHILFSQFHMGLYLLNLI